MIADKRIILLAIVALAAGYEFESLLTKDDLGIKD
jgi:hypothetical protein